MNELLLAIAEPSKRLILELLQDAPRNVSELVRDSGMKQPNISNHLAKLREKGVVVGTRSGRQIVYELASPEVTKSLSILLRRAVAPPPPHDYSLEAAVQDYAKAAIRGEESACIDIIDQLLAQGFELVRIYHHVLTTAMHRIGDWYNVSAINEAQEHMASAITERVMGHVMSHSSPPKSGTKRAVAGCAEGNHHTIGLRMLSDVLVMSEWDVSFIGANVPISAFVQAVLDKQAHLVLIACGVDESIETTLKTIKKLRQLPAKNRVMRIIAGGQRVNENPAVFIEAGADFTPKDLDMFVNSTLPQIMAIPTSIRNN